MTDTQTLYSFPVTVLGIGNVILKDEGFGVRVAEYLAANYDFDDSVQIIDGGTLGIELTHYVTDTQKLLVIDSIDGGAIPGTIFCFRNEEVSAHFAKKISAHEVGIQDVLTVLKLTGRAVPQVTVIGVQPYDIGAGVDLTDDMAKLMSKITSMALEELGDWGVDFRPKHNFEKINLNSVSEAIFPQQKCSN